MFDDKSNIFSKVVLNLVVTYSQMALCLSKNHMSICGYVIKLLSLVRPGATWIYGFFKRNPQLSPRKPENLGHARAGVTETVIRQWFDTPEKFFAERA